MGKGSKIEWTDHTFNPWWGCAAVSPGCKHCYAETLAQRFGTQWGVRAPRRLFGTRHWVEPLGWDRAARAAGERHRVFTASMADVFDDRPELEQERWRLFLLIEATAGLDWLILTKRPENVARLAARWERGWPPNAWLGVSVEDQRRADERIPHLLRLPAAVRFLSCEPLLGPVDLRRWVFDRDAAIRKAMYGPASLNWDQADHRIAEVGIHWVICGGESGPGARPMHPDWARSLHDQCASVGVPFFFKQWGEWVPRVRGEGAFNSNDPHGRDRLVSRDGVEYCFVETAGEGAAPMSRVGKKAAGALLDGREHKAFPS